MWGYFVDLVLLFALYSFAGWVLETTYASISARKFINRGFLSGPFCPIYGFGAVIITQTFAFLSHILGVHRLSLFFTVTLSILLATILEYITGFLLEKIFHCKWWDYSDEFLNIHGRICLKFSLLWGVLAYILISVLQPVVARKLSLLPYTYKNVLAFILIGYFIFDTIKSSLDALGLKQAVLAYYKNPVEKTYEQIIKYKRILMAFPKLSFLYIGKVNQEIRGFVHENFKKIKTQFKGKKR